MHRPTVGILAIVLLIAAGFLYLWPDTGTNQQQLLSACLRIGAMLGALWLALPQVNKPRSWWILGATFLTVLIVARFPRLFWIPLVALIALAILRPRFGARRPSAPRK
jgi:hypothetical protein